MLPARVWLAYMGGQCMVNMYVKGAAASQMMEEHVISGMRHQLCAYAHHAGRHRVGKGVFESV